MSLFNELTATVEVSTLTEDEIREIVRDELARERERQAFELVRRRTK